MLYLVLLLSIACAVLALAAALSGREWPFSAALACGASAVVLTVAHLTRETNPSTAAWAMSLLLCAGVVLGLSAVWRLSLPQGVLAVVSLVAGFVVFLVAVGADVEARAADPHPDANTRIVAMGDSYIAGEGTPAYLAGTDVPGSNTCHRSAAAYPYVVANELGASLRFVSCSGARTYHVLERAQHERSLAAPDGSVVFGARPQIAELRAAGRVDLVLIGIGGNDAGFGEIGAACATPGAPDCRRSAPFWIDRLARETFPALVRTLRAVRKAAGEAPVFMTTYPNPIGPRSCDVLQLSEGELRFVRDVFVGRLNSIVSLAAAVARVHVIPLEEALVGYRLCERRLAEAAVNFIDFGFTRGTRLDLLLRNLPGLGHKTFHPNALGHTLMAERVLPIVRAALTGGPPPLPPAPPAGTKPSRFVPEGVGPPVGPHGFPSGTACKGDKVLVVTRTAVRARVRRIALSDLAPRSTVCYRAYSGSWRWISADGKGRARVPVNVRRPSFAATNEILARGSGGVWRKVLVTRLGADAPSEQAEPEPTLNGLVALVVVLLAIFGAALVIRHRRRRRRTTR